MSTSSNDTNPVPAVRPRTSRRRTNSLSQVGQQKNNNGASNNNNNNPGKKEVLSPEIRSSLQDYPINLDSDDIETRDAGGMMEDEYGRNGARSSSSGGMGGSLALQPAKLTRTSAKQMIVQAIDMLESENEELKRLNKDMMNEMNKLKKENEQLRKGLDSAIEECQSVQQAADNIERQNTNLKHEIQMQNRRILEESKEKSELESMVKEETSRQQVVIDRMKDDINQKEKELRLMSRELEMLRGKIEKSSRRNFNDRDIELLQELEMLKEEHKGLASSRDDLERLKKDLLKNIDGLKGELRDRTNELKNENRRHTLLTKEFNSLLEENNHLKLQLRRRQQGLVVRPLQEERPSEETMTDLKSSFTRQQTNVSSNKPLLITKGRTFVAPNIGATPRDTRNSQHHQSQPLSRGEDNSESNSRSSPESLPSLTGSKTWRP